MAKMLFIEPSKCTGCRTCELVCSIKNEGMANPALSRIQVIAYKNQGVRVPMTCQQCEQPVCITVCPVGAHRKDRDLGIVKHNSNKCIGCKLCAATCPFGAISINTKTGKVFKCEQCGGRPECARFCEDKAITFIEAEMVPVKKRRQIAQDFTKFIGEYAGR